MIRILALALLTPAASFAACPANPSSLSGHADSAEKAFASLDAESFKTAMASLEEELGCLESVIPPGIAAQVHKAHGLSFFLARDLESATSAFRAAAAIDETMALDPSYAPDGGPLHSAWVAAQQAGPSMRIPLPTEQWIDGLRAADRPKETPYVLQRENGDTFQGSWLAADAELPEWAAAPGEGGGVSEADPNEGGEDPVGHGAGKKSGEGLSPTTLQLATASGTALLLSGGLFAAALAQEGKFKSDDTLTWTERVDMQKRTNNLGYAAQGIGIVGLGLGATAVVSTRW
ncbi:MAG: hypothetical protein EP330_27045 [Deltaproteobacteria bacterium]|nr:MAG: hypothetical protein EP330_27045 [Deltaproteobacteria bacterium]